MPPEGPNFLSYRAGLTVMLAVAVSGATDCRTGRELIGLHPASQRGFDLTGETAVPS